VEEQPVKRPKEMADALQAVRADMNQEMADALQAVRESMKVVNATDSSGLSPSIFDEGVSGLSEEGVYDANRSALSALSLDGSIHVLDQLDIDEDDLSMQEEGEEESEEEEEEESEEEDAEEESLLTDSAMTSPLPSPLQDPPFDGIYESY
jgi:hypothetical protein